jgi:leader peptidase (prepilin peptidase) / N-methyltransferase
MSDVLAQLPTWLWIGYLAAIGASLGSFVNVVIARLPTGESLVRPRSRCPSCKTPIAWYDNVPILSWLVLRGHCRRCKAPISARYMIVELLMAVLTIALFFRFGLTPELFTWMLLCAGLLAIVFLDIDHYWVPDVITFPCMALALLAAFLPGGIDPLEAIVGLVPALFLWGFAWMFEKIARREGMGLGDIKLLALIGLGLGALPTLSVLFLGAVQGSVVGVLVVMRGGHKRVEPPPGSNDDWQPHPRAIPFGPFLILGCFEVLLLPETFGRIPELVQSLVATR